MSDEILSEKGYFEPFISDSYRPTYHFVTPDEGRGPGDPNGAFFADGVYHLCFLYYNKLDNSYHWGHISSRDLLHWRYHPDALTKYEGDSRGCFSGGAFVDDDGTAYITFHRLRNATAGEEPLLGAITIAKSTAPYEKWELVKPVVLEETFPGITNVEIDGETVHLACADPSNIWKENGYYYVQHGNYGVLCNYGRKPDSLEKYRGGWTDLFRSKDLKEWTYLHRFYKIDYSGENDWPDATEDAMCPSFLPLFDAKSGGRPTGKWLQLFISHNKGGQYFVGTFENEKFHPEVHGRFTWHDLMYFAPEALVDDKNRQIVWTWIGIAKEKAPEGYLLRHVYSLPRSVWWADGELHMAPVDELDQLQCNHQSFDPAKGEKLCLKNGEAFRLKAVCGADPREKTGFKIRVNEAKCECVEIYYDPADKKLVLCSVLDGGNTRRIEEAAPFELKKGEKLSLDIFADKMTIEVYANERQGLGRHIFVDDPENALGVSLIGPPEGIEKIDAWEMTPCFAF